MIFSDRCFDAVFLRHSRINVNGLCDLEGNAYRVKGDFWTKRFKGHPDPVDEQINGRLFNRMPVVMVAFFWLWPRIIPVFTV